MTSPGSADWLSDIAAPLAAQFGQDVTVRRNGNSVCWAYAGQSVVVEMSSPGVLRATFVDVDGFDEVSAAPAAAAYRTGATYGLSASGCSRMVADLVDFFSGVREPRFRFIDAYAR